MHIYKNIEDKDKLYLDLGQYEPRFIEIIILDHNSQGGIYLSDIIYKCDSLPDNLEEELSLNFIEMLKKSTAEKINFCKTDFMHVDCDCDMIWNIITYKLNNYGRQKKHLNLKVKKQ